MRNTNRFLCFWLGVLQLIASSQCLSATIWRDAFNGAPELPWVNVRGAWQVDSGTYSATAPGNLPPSAALLPYDLSNFSLELDLRQPVDGGVWLRTNSDASSGVILVVFAHQLYWHVISDPIAGPWTVYGHTSLSPNLGSDTNRIRVTGNGPILRVYLNGAKTAASTLDLGTVTNPPGMDYLHGRVGLYDNAEPGTRFDNVRLEAGTPIEVVAIGDAGNQAVRLFPVAATGDVAPIATLAGPNTGLTDVRGVVMDSEVLYVSSGTGKYIKAFSLANLGDSPPLRTIQGPSTGLGSVYHIALVGQDLFAASDTEPVRVFAADAGGNVAPIRTISATGAYALDTSAGELFVAGHFVNPSSVFAYPDTADSGTSPLRTLAGSSTGLGGTNLGLASTATELFVGQYTEGRIRTYPRGANGDAPPTRTIAGPATGLAASVDIAVRGEELYAANSGFGNVLVFPRSANGDVAPSRVLGGPQTGFNAPFAIDFGIYVLSDDLFTNGFERVGFE